MNIAIVSGGKAPSEKLIRGYLNKVDFIIAADKGSECLYKYGIKADLLVGDFDSANKEILDVIKGQIAEVLEFPPEKDYTDTEIAFNLALENNPNEIVLLGATGTRYDHSLSNIGLLKKALSKGVNARIIDDNNLMFLTDKNISLKGNPGDTISFHAYSEEVKNFSIKNSKYDLNNHLLRLGDGLTTSNEFLEDYIDISFDSGIILVLYTKD